jgi:hypothetical protein
MKSRLILSLPSSPKKIYHYYYYYYYYSTDFHETETFAIQATAARSVFVSNVLSNYRRVSSVRMATCCGL